MWNHEVASITKIRIKVIQTWDSILCYLSIVIWTTDREVQTVIILFNIRSVIQVEVENHLSQERNLSEK